MSYAGADGLLVRSLLREQAVKGLVIAGVGLGNVSSAMFEAIEDARKRGLPVVISTRVPMGRVFPLTHQKALLLLLKKSDAFWPTT